MSKSEGERRTGEARTHFKRAKDETGKAMAIIQKCVEDEVHVSVGKNLTEWLEENFGYSSSYIFARIRQRRALQAVGASEKVIQSIPQDNAQQLTRLPEKQRKAVIEKAVKLPPKEFKGVVEEIREKKLGITPEPWKTWAVRVPLPVYDALIEARDKLGRVLEVDLTNEETFTKNMITVMEALASLVNQTDESQLKVEIEGA